MQGLPFMRTTYGRASVVATALGGVLLTFSCARDDTSRAAEPGPNATTDQAFTSADAVLVDLDLDATLIADTMDPPKVRDHIATQLLYLVGELNGDQSVGQHPKAEFSVTTFGATAGVPGSWTFTYHAKLPVAWGASAPPATYAVALPLRVGEDDRAAFAEKYAKTCTDPEGGVKGAADASRMFLFYRPQRPGCSLLPGDVTRATATLTPAPQSTVPKYPEYHRVWDDDVLNVVAVFGHEFDEANHPNDGGAAAYQDFLTKADAFMKSATTNAARVAVDGGTRLTGDLADNRKVVVDTLLAPAHLGDARTAFDDWYDARTPLADLVIYSGHAGLGENARKLTQKGVFTQGRYVVVAINGCDTFAYLDPSFVDRLGGTKNADIVSNVLGGFFHSGDETSLLLIGAFVTAIDAPKTYADILAKIDKTQIPVVSGEEDNVFMPGMIPKPKSSSSSGSSGGASTSSPPNESSDAPNASPPSSSSPAPTDARDTSSSSGCATSPSAPHRASALLALLTATVLIRAARRRDFPRVAAAFAPRGKRSRPRRSRHA